MCSLKAPWRARTPTVISEEGMVTVILLCTAEIDNKEQWREKEVVCKEVVQFMTAMTE